MRYRTSMSSRKFYIIDNPQGQSDGVIKNKNKELLGYAYDQPAPVGSYIECSLDGYWIVSDEDYKKLKKIKKNNVKI